MPDDELRTARSIAKLKKNKMSKLWRVIKFVLSFISTLNKLYSSTNKSETKEFEYKNRYKEILFVIKISLFYTRVYIVHVVSFESFQFKKASLQTKARSKVANLIMSIVIALSSSLDVKV